MSVVIFVVFVGEGVESGFGGAVWGGEVYIPYMAIYTIFRIVVID